MTKHATCTASGLYRETGELSIEIPALRRATLSEVQALYPWVTGTLDTSPDTPVKLVLTTVLDENEEFIGGGEYGRRLATRQDVLLGLQHREWLLQHLSEFPDAAGALATISVEFPGTVLLKGGVRNAPCILDGKSSYGWLGSGVKPTDRVAIAKF